MNTCTQLLLTKAVNSLFHNPWIIKPQVYLQGVSVHYLRWSASPTCTASCSVVTSCQCSEDSPPEYLVLHIPEHVKQAAGIVTWWWFSVLYKAWSLRCPFPASSIRCFSSSSLGFKMFSKKSDNKITFVFLCRWSQEFQSTWDWGFDDFR